MKAIEHKSRMRYIAHNPTGELIRLITHQFTTKDRKNRITLERVSKMARCLKLSIGSK